MRNVTNADDFSFEALLRFVCSNKTIGISTLGLSATYDEAEKTITELQTTAIYVNDISLPKTQENSCEKRTENIWGKTCSQQCV